MVLNDIIDQAAAPGGGAGGGSGGRVHSRPSHHSGATEEEHERVPLKALIKQMIVQGCFRCIGMHFFKVLIKFKIFVFGKKIYSSFF